jgi:ribosome-binding protein aMBF1 (putative translation factor)
MKSPQRFASKSHQARYHARVQAGLDLKQLARKLGRKTSTIRLYEKRGVDNAALAVAWAKALDTRLEIFL